MTAMTDKKRVMGMIRGEEECKSFFALQSRSQARTIIIHYLNDPNDIEEVLDLIGDEQITGWQLRDVFDENKNLNVIKKKLQNKIVQN
jgi:hypothetical protein